MQHKYKKTQEKKGFSLIELSIVILIVSILITGSLGISKTAINNSKAKVTKERMDTVYKAFSNFLAVNRRLPCPAILTVPKGTSTYGTEAANQGTCTSTFTSSTNAPNLVYGMVPILALNLDPDMAEDGFGTKFTYVADKRFTRVNTSATDTLDGFEITKGIPSPNDTSSTDLLSADVQGPLGTLLLSNRNAVFVLLSHGANKFNGFNATGTTQNGVSTVTDENDNSCNTCAVSGTTSFNRIFVASSTDANFDDSIIFKTKTQLVRDAGLEFIICAGLEAQTSLSEWGLTVANSRNADYNCNLCSRDDANVRRTCGKFGIWSAITTPTCTAGSIQVCS